MSLDCKDSAKRNGEEKGQTDFQAFIITPLCHSFITFMPLLTTTSMDEKNVSLCERKTHTYTHKIKKRGVECTEKNRDSRWCLPRLPLVYPRRREWGTATGIERGEVGGGGGGQRQGIPVVWHIVPKEAWPAWRVFTVLRRWEGRFLHSTRPCLLQPLSCWREQNKKWILKGCFCCFMKTAPSIHPGKDEGGATTSGGLQGKASHLPLRLQ